MVHQSPPKKQMLTQLTRKINQGKIWLRKPTRILSQGEKVLTQLKKIEITNTQRNS